MSGATGARPAARGLVVAAPASGSGKTLLTLGLVRALREAGARVAVAKTGPDYIDPGFLAAAAEGACVNLDPWAMRPGTLARLAGEAAAGADLLIVEGVMGLFDGPAGGGGSTADLAARLGLPVVLAIDAARQAQSAGALARGFATMRADVTVAGVIVNRVAGARHAALLGEGIAAANLPLLGAMPGLEGLALESRHLGLVQARERAGLEALVAAAAAAARTHLDLAAIAGLAAPLAAGEPGPAAAPVPPPGQRIAIAHDDAFAFVYAHLLAAWRAAGAEIRPFSPLAGEAPDADADAVYLPGGYPELHAGALAANRAFRDALGRAARAGAAIHGECGGYMVLGRGLVDGEGRRHEMAGLLGLETSFAERRLTLGYREAVLAADGALGPAGTRLRGHAFHYATVLAETGAPLLRLADAAGADLGPAGLAAGRVTGSFFHLIDAA